MPAGTGPPADTEFRAGAVPARICLVKLPWPRKVTEPAAAADGLSAAAGAPPPHPTAAAPLGSPRQSAWGGCAQADEAWPVSLVPEARAAARAEAPRRTGSPYGWTRVIL